jgi:hypothetical protein
MYPNHYYDTYFGQNWVLLCSFLSKDIHKCLTYISFSGIIYIDDKTVLNLVEHFKGQLITLNFHGCEDLTDQSISHVAELCVCLKDLDVGGIPLLTDTSIHSLTAHAIILTRLVLGPNFEEPAHRRTTRVTTAAIEELVKQRGHGLISLGLGKLADSALLQLLAVYCPDLTDLNIRDCRHAVVDDVSRLSASCRNITRLNVKGTPAEMPVSCQFILLRDLPHLSDYSFSPYRVDGEYKYMFGLLAFKFKSLLVCDMDDARVVGQCYERLLDFSAYTFLYTCNTKFPFLNGRENLDVQNQSMGSLMNKCRRSTLKELGFDSRAEKFYGHTMVGNFFSCDNIVSLETLKLRDMATVGDTHLNSIALICTRLKHFDVLGTNKITSSGVVAVCKSNPGLLSVSLGAGVQTPGVSKLDDEVLIDGICTLQHLSSLVLFAINDITSGAVDEVVKSCKFLEELYMRECPQCEFDEVYKCLSKSNVIDGLKVKY